MFLSSAWVLLKANTGDEAEYFICFFVVEVAVLVRNFVNIREYACLLRLVGAQIYQGHVSSRSNELKSSH